MLVNVSIGEVVDKYCILELKLKYIIDENKRLEITRELNELSECKQYIDKMSFYYKILLHVNDLIWILTDKIKTLNYADSNFAKISYDIFELNQKRFRIKNFFNILNNSILKEQKSYLAKFCIIKISDFKFLYEKMSEINYLSIEYDYISFDCGFIDDVKFLLDIPNIIYDEVIEGDIINLEEYNISEENKNIYNQGLKNIMKLNNSPNMGIGDLLLIKNICNNINADVSLINLSDIDIRRYKCEPEKYLNFISKFIKLIFPKCKVNIGPFQSENYLLYFTNVPFNTCYLYNNIKFEKPVINYNNYIIFHTKVRIDGCGDKFLNIDLPLLDVFFKMFRTNKTIIILGEKEVEENLEVKVHKINSIYKNLIQLSENNKVIDLSTDNLCSGTLDFEHFLYDIELINKADYNITFGIGGPFNICQCFSKNNICFISDFYDPKFMCYFQNYQNINNNMYRDINTFFEKIINI